MAMKMMKMPMERTLRRMRTTTMIMTLLTMMMKMKKKMIQRRMTLMRMMMNRRTRKKTALSTWRNPKRTVSLLLTFRLMANRSSSLITTSTISSSKRRTHLSMDPTKSSGNWTSSQSVSCPKLNLNNHSHSISINISISSNQYRPTSYRQVRARRQDPGANRPRGIKQDAIRGKLPGITKRLNSSNNMTINMTSIGRQGDMGLIGSSIKVVNNRGGAIGRIKSIADTTLIG